MTELLINEKLAEQQRVTQGDRERMEVLYKELDHVLSNPEEYKNPSEAVTLIEFELQECWHFPKDSNYHKYQNEIRGCKCARTDNAERLGTPYRSVNITCPWHGQPLKGD